MAKKEPTIEELISKATISMIKSYCKEVDQRFTLSIAQKCIDVELKKIMNPSVKSSKTKKS